MDKNCLTCKRFVDCTNKKRRYDFVCSKYTPKLITSVSLDDFGDKTTSIDHFKFDPDKQEDFDIFSLIDSLTDSENVLPRDIKIDDRDIPQAPNFFEFATDPRFLAVTPFPKQVEVASNYFNEICWKCSNREWKKGFPTSCTMEDIRENIQFFDKGVCPKCGRRKSVQIRKEKMRPYVQLAGLCGQRSGKSATFDMMEAYRLHWCLKIPKLAQFYGLLPSSQLHTSYVALTFGQAKETIYDTLYDYMTTSPWWQSYREMLDYYGNKYGEELYTIKDTFFRFRTQSITGYPAGPDRRKLRGRCLCGHTLVHTTKGLYKASDKQNLLGSKAIKGLSYPTITGHEKQLEKKNAIRICLENGIVLDVSDDHRIPTFDVKTKNLILKEARDLLNEYVICQVHQTVPIVENVDFYLDRNIKYTFDKLYKAISFQIELFSKGQYCIRKGKTVYWDCNDIHYLIPGTNVYVNNALNKKYNVQVENEVKQYIDKGYVFSKVSEIKSLGLKTVYDIEVDSEDHLFTANGVLVHNTRCSGAIDEIGWFLAAQAGTIKYDVDEIHKAMLNSFKTVHAATRKLYEQGYDNVLNPILANISSPSSVNDKIMRLYEQSKTSHYIYGFRYASWEFNPTLSEDDFIDEKINQPKEFMRDYMTIPPLSSNPFIEDVEQVGPCLTSNDNAFTLTTDKITTKSGRVMSGAKIQRKWVGKSNKILALDAGLCVTGDTLISTVNRGLIPIKDLCPKKKKYNEVSILLNSLDKPVMSKYVHYMGKKEVKEVITYSGHSILGTNNHPQLVLKANGDLQWTRIKDLQIGDLLCFNTNAKLNNHKLSLNLKPLPYSSGSNRNIKDKGIYKNKFFGLWEVQCRLDGKQKLIGRYKTKKEAYKVRDEVFVKYNIPLTFLTKRSHINYPKYMSEDLAYLLGMIVSEGSYDKYYCRIANTKTSILNKCAKIIKSLFGIQTLKYSNKAVIVSNSEFCDILRQLGLVNKSEKRGVRPSRYKYIPSCILQSDVKSQCAYLAGFIDGDGSVCISDTSRIYLYSSSIKMIKQLQIMLTNLGVMTRIEGKPTSVNKDYKNQKRVYALVTHSIIDFEKLYSYIKPYLAHPNKKAKYIKSYRPSKFNSIPTTWFYDFIMSRRLKANVNGTFFLSDSGKEIIVKGFATMCVPNTGIQYNMLDNGYYNDFEQLLKKISKKEYEKYRYLTKLHFRYSKVTKILKGGVQPVYDITVQDNQTPAYLANGMVIHNTNNSFAICLGHNEEVTIDGVKHLFPVYDCLAEAIPEKNCPINFSSMYNNVIKPIIEEYGVRLVVADRWNSAKVLDDIETDFGVKVETYSVKYSDFSTFKEMILNNQIKFPRCEGSYKNVSPDVVDYPFGFIGKPIQHFILQCITVQDFGDKSVTKGDGYTDDIFRATVLANSYLVDKDYKNMFVGETTKRGGGAVGSRGDGGTLSSNLGARPTGYSTSTSYISRG